MLGGIVFQLGMCFRTYYKVKSLIDCYPTVAITIYVALATEVVLRFSFKRPIRRSKFLSSSGSDETTGPDPQAHLEPKIKLMLVGLSLSTFFIFVRCVTDNCGHLFFTYSA